MVDYSKFEKSLKNLELQAANFQVALQRPELKELDREGLAESVIKRFEICYDSLWKVLKRHLVEEQGLADVPNSPKPIFKLAAKSQLLGDGLEDFLNFAEARIATTHDYSDKKARETLELIGIFIERARALQRIMVPSP